jgi:uncharacterized protein (TIRG00374 family)
VLIKIQAIGKRIIALLRGRVGWLLRFLITAGLFFVIFRYMVKPQEFFQALPQVLVGWLVVALLVKWTGILAAILRWDLLLRAQGIRVPFTRLVASFLVGRFFGMFTPSTLGLDVYRAYDMGALARNAIGSVAVIVVEKITGFFTLSLLVLVTLPAGVRFIAPQLVLFVGLVFFLPVAVAFVLLLWPNAFERLLRLNFPGKARVEKWLRQAVAAITTYRHHRRSLWLAVLLGLVVHGATAVMYYCTARAVQAPVSLADMLFVGPLIIVSTVGIPTMGGEGARELSSLVLLERVGVPRALGGLIGHLGFWSGEFLPVVLGGLILALRPAATRPTPLPPEEANLGPGPSPTQDAARSRRFLRDGLLPGAASGALAIVLLGIVETLYLTARNGNAAFLAALPHAGLLYGAIGLVGGAGLGTLLWFFFRTRPAGEAAGPVSRWTAGLLLAGLGLLVARYRILRDIFEEKLRTFSPQGLLVHAALLLGALALLGVTLLAGKRLTRTRAGRFLAHGGCFLAVPVLLGGAFLAAALVQPHTTPEPARPLSADLQGRPNIVLIGIDALRADRLSCYGYDQQTSPNMDALATEGVLYRNMLSQSSWTRPSFATILTSLYPSSHTAVSKVSRLPQSALTLAEVLQKAGYRTGGFADNINIAPIFGFGQGFDSYTYLEPVLPLGASDTSSELALYQAARRGYYLLVGEQVWVQEYYQDAATVTTAATEWLAAHRGERFFLFLHYMETHDPYMEHPYNGVGYARASDQNPDPALAPTFSALYDGEVRYVDEYIGELFAFLKEAGLYEDTLIVLTADHGEEFQEHGGWWHGQTLYEEQIRVPLIIKYPGRARAGTVVEEYARSLDIAPTVVDVAALSIPGVWQGRSLWSDTEPPAYFFAEEDLEGNVIRAVQQGDYKLILTNRDNPRGLPAEALYNLDRDPGEHDNRVQEEAGWAATLREVLGRAQAEALAQRLRAEQGTIDEEAEELLRKLGY